MDAQGCKVRGFVVPFGYLCVFGINVGFQGSGSVVFGGAYGVVLWMLREGGLLYGVVSLWR